MDPFSLGMMGLTGLSDPSSFASMMSGMGISPPGGGGTPSPGGANMFGSIPSMFGLQDPSQSLGASLLGGPPAPATTEGWDPTVTPAGPQGQNPLMGAANNLAKLGLQGVKAPPPVQPIMSGGVSGGAPVHPAAAGAASHSSNLQAALASLIAAHSNPTPRVPNLGALIHGGV